MLPNNKHKPNAAPSICAAYVIFSRDFAKSVLDNDEEGCVSGNALLATTPRTVLINNDNEANVLNKNKISSLAKTNWWRVIGLVVSKISTPNASFSLKTTIVFCTIKTTKHTKLIAINTAPKMAGNPAMMPEEKIPAHSGRINNKAQ